MKFYAKFEFFGEFEKKMVLSAQGKDMGEIKSNLAALSAQMAVMRELKKRGKGSPKGEKRVSFQENKEALNYKGATRKA